MENTTKEQIISTCQEIMSNIIGYHKAIVIKEDSSAYYYEIKASTILQIHQTSFGIYGSAKIKVDDNVEILGHCDDLNFLGL